MAQIDKSKRIQVIKDGDTDRYQVYSFGVMVGMVFPVESGGREMWDYEGNPYSLALFHKPYMAARKLVERRGRPNLVAQLNRQPLAHQSQRGG